MFLDAHGFIVEFDLLDNARCGRGLLQGVAAVGTLIETMRVHVHGLSRKGHPRVRGMPRLPAAGPLRLPVRGRRFRGLDEITGRRLRGGGRILAGAGELLLQLGEACLKFGQPNLEGFAVRTTRRDSVRHEGRAYRATGSGARAQERKPRSQIGAIMEGARWVA
jgi:hypothetical protein